MSDRIKLFVGTAPNGEDAESQMVLEYTARKYCSLPIDIVWMKHTNDTTSFWHGWNSRMWATPFSGFRWGIPEYCDFKGQAIYMDSDMIVLGDLAELWNIPFDYGKILMGKGGWRFCVSKWNCAATNNILPEIKWIRQESYSHQRLAQAFATPANPNYVQYFDHQWNSFDGENDRIEDIKILHYTDMSTQMHLKYAKMRLAAEGRQHWYDGPVREHRRPDIIALFDKYYIEALHADMNPEDYYDLDNLVSYEKESQAQYNSNNGYDVSKGE